MIKPILFNTDMVQAIQDKRKTVTRRILKLPKHIKKQENGLYSLFTEGTCYENQHLEEIVNYIKPPYQKGDILYVRETWSKNQSNECIANTTGKCPYGSCKTAPGPCFKEYIYKATDKLTSRVQRWHPSIHMPKEAARILLKVTDVRVERLQNMTLDDFLREGISIRPEAFNDPQNAYMQAKEAFKQLWDSTIRKDQIDVYGWDANPWVWVIEFERYEKPEEEM